MKLTAQYVPDIIIRCISMTCLWAIVCEILKTSQSNIPSFHQLILLNPEWLVNKWLKKWMTTRHLPAISLDQWSALVSVSLHLSTWVLPMSPAHHLLLCIGSPDGSIAMLCKPTEYWMKYQLFIGYLNPIFFILDTSHPLTAMLPRFNKL